MLCAHLFAQGGVLFGRARDLERGREPLESSHGKIEPLVDVHEEGVVRFELLTGEAAVDGGHRIGDRPRAFGGRDATKATVQDEPPANVVEDGAYACLLR